MKIILLLFLLSTTSATFAQTTEKIGTPTLTKEERAKVIKLLLDSQKETLDAVKNLSEAQWNYKPSPEKWSVGEVAEHIWLAESLLYGAVQRAIAAPENAQWENQTQGKNERVEQILLNRTGKAQAPEQIKPTGKTRAEILKGLEESRANTLKFAKETNLPLKSHTADHPFKVFGTLNAYQWLIYIPLHNMRHNQQIAEVKSSPGFPKS